MTDGLGRIVDGGYCVGCGACSQASPALAMEKDEFGQYCVRQKEGTVLLASAESLIATICPFSGDGPNEDELALDQYGPSTTHDEDIGRYVALFAGHVLESDFRSIGASGGLITWVLCELLARGEIDGVVHVKRCEPDGTGTLFKYGISKTPDEVKGGAKSRYYPVEASEALEQIRQTPGRYVFVGLPCFVKAVRRLSRVDPIVKERVRFTVGLVCGHLKTGAFADCYGWQVDIPPGRLEQIDFRVKRSCGTAGEYAVSLQGAGVEVTKPARDFFGSNWGNNFFRYSACDCCDDVFAETADLSVGDAWLPPYVNDPGGNGIMVVRDLSLLKIISSAIVEERLALDELSPDGVRQSQAGGLRDRREGLAFRLHMKARRGEWYPRKRVAPSAQGITLSRRLIYANRILMRKQSHLLWKKAVERDSYAFFERRMRPIVFVNDLLGRWPNRVRVAEARRMSKRCLRRFAVKR